jgi:hypothetical protein
VKVLPGSGLPARTLRTVGCAKRTGPKPTKHVLITPAPAHSRAQVFEDGTGSGPFILWYDEHNLGAGQLMEEIQRKL